MGILWLLVVGLVAGLIARALVPGRQSMGLFMTMLLGVVGSFVGGFIGSLFTRRSVTDLHSTGLIMSVVGAIVVLLLVQFAGRGRRIHA
jgi:uncharacterized membrane protein YeaQ/YmgE (transglycosylase-associated protein family)